MISVRIAFLTLVVGLVSPTTLADDRPLAFPGAIGFGKYTVGGNGGKTLVVNSLEDPKDVTPGTLRWAVTQSFPRTIRFTVSGIIHLQKPLIITGDNLTLDGSTSPGGIVIRGAETQIKANQVIIRYLRFRPGQHSPEGDAMTARRQHDIIVDHCSLSWANDEVGSFYNNENFTLQYSLLADSLRDSGHSKGEHGYGGIWGGKNASFLRNVVANHTSRNPRINGYRLGTPYSQSETLVDIRNNVIFNWGYKSVYGAEGGKFNLVDNVFIPGPASTVNWIFELWHREDISMGQGYIHGNTFAGSADDDSVSEHSRLTVVNLDKEEASAMLDDFLVSGTFYEEPAALSPDEAYQQLVQFGDVGATLPVQDSVDKHVLDMIRHPQTIKEDGIIDSELEVISSWQDYEAEFTQPVKSK